MKKIISLFFLALLGLQVSCADRPDSSEQRQEIQDTIRHDDEVDDRDVNE